MIRMAFDPTLRYRFVFQFDLSYFDEEEAEGDPPLTVMLFQFLDLDERELTRLTDLTMGEEDDFEGVRDDLEGIYGVHDFATTGDAEVVGYHSYEVKADQTQELMTRWRQFFIDKGFNVGEVQTMTGAQYEQLWPWNT